MSIIEKISGLKMSAQVVSTIEITPETLFFTPPNKCWLGVKLYMNDLGIGEGKVFTFTEQEIESLNKIVLAAIDRHRETLQKHGNL